MFGGGPPPEPKGDLTQLLDMIGLDWPTTEIVWNGYNPHPATRRPAARGRLHSARGTAPRSLQREAGRDLGAAGSRHAFPGPAPAKGASPEFTPLLRTNDTGGTSAGARRPSRASWASRGINPNRRHFASGTAYTLAARIQGPPATEAPTDEKDETKDAQDKKGDPESRHQRDRHRRPRPDLRAVLRAPAAEDREPRARQRHVRAQLRRRARGRRVVRRPPQAPAQAPDPRHASRSRPRSTSKKRQSETKAAEDAAKEQLDVAQKRLDKQVDADPARARTSTSGPRRSCS